MENILKTIFEIENKLKIHEYDKSTGLEVIKGTNKVIFSAPHSVEQLREGKIKLAESRTAGLVDILARKTHAFGIFKTHNFDDDANYDKQSYYKDKIEELVLEYNIKLLIDLHTMSPVREHNIDIGTGCGANIFEDKLLVDNLVTSLSNIDKVVCDYKFTATYENTISAYISKKCKIPCLQIEINWDILNDKSENFQIKKILDCLEKFTQLMLLEDY